MLVTVKIVLIALANVAVLSACSDKSDTYEQTWPKSYVTTTCAEWTSQMSDDQQFAASADFIWKHHSKHGATERPDYQPILDYQSVMRQACAEKPQDTIAQVADRIGFPD
jgi:hypothetical protein